MELEIKNNRPKSAKKRSLVVEQLEPRVLFSADIPSLVDLGHSDETEPYAPFFQLPVAPSSTENTTTDSAANSFTGTHHTNDHALTATTQKPESEPVLDTKDKNVNFVFVDTSIDGADRLLDGIKNRHSDNVEWIVVTIDPTTDGIEHITETLTGVTDIDAIHILSHGNETGFQLGDVKVDASTFDLHKNDFNLWRNSLDKDADILIYGCDLAASESGRQLINDIAEHTGSDVAASIDTTGHASHNADWELEYQHGDVETGIALSDATQSEWYGSLPLGVAPKDISSGIELNKDGGNDSYLQAVNGNSVFGGATTLTVELSMQLESQSGTTPHLISYATATEDEEFKIFLSASNEVSVSIGGITFTSNAHPELYDGTVHQIGVSWDNTNGNIGIYVDGELSDNGILGAGYTLGATGALVIGQGQPSGGQVSNQVASGTFYDVRVWNEVRSEAEISLNNLRKIDPANFPSSLIANWQFDGFDVSGEVVDVVTGTNNLSVQNTSGNGFSASTPVKDLHVTEHSAVGTSVGYVVPTDPDLSNDVVLDGLFLKADTPTGTYQTYTAGQQIGDWLVETNSVDLISSPFADSPLGGKGIDLERTTLSGSISTPLSLTPGAQYQVIFSVSGNWTGGSDLKELRASVNGTFLDVAITEPAHWSESNMLWDQRTFTFTAGSSSEDLVIAATGTPSGFGAVVADVQVIEVPQAVSIIESSDPTLEYDAATGKFYKVVSTPENIVTATNNANSEMINGVGGQLATIRSEYEDALIHNLIQTYGTTTHYYLGGTDSTNDGEWNWIENGTESDRFWNGGTTGSAPAGAYSAFSGEPNGGASENYLMRRQTDGAWLDIDGTYTDGYVIEWDASEVLGSYTFGLLNDAGGRFAIDSSTGEITVSNSALIDFDNANSHDVTVEVTDASGNSHNEVLSITVDNIAEAAHTIPGNQPISEDQLLTFSTANGNDITVSDTVTGTDSLIRASLTVTDGVLTLPQTTGLTFVTGTNTSASFVIEGIESDVNAALDGLTFTPDKNFNGVVMLDITTELPKLIIGPDLTQPFSSPNGDTAARNDLLVHEEFGGINSNGTISSLQIAPDSNNTPIDFDLLVMRPDTSGGYEIIHRVSLTDSDITSTAAGIRTLDIGTLHVQSGDILAHWSSNDPGSIPYTGLTGGSMGWSNYPTSSLNVGSTVQAGLIQHANGIRLYGLNVDFQSMQSDVDFQSTQSDSIQITVASVNDAPELQQPEAITNGTFSSSLNDWSTSGQTDLSDSALRFGQFNAGGSPTASQTISVVSGGTYELSFDYKDNRTYLNQSLQVTVNGASNLLTTPQIITDISGSTFVRYTYTFTADSDTAVVTFTDTSETAGVTIQGTIAADGFIDNISVQHISGIASRPTYVEGGAAVVLDSAVEIFDAELSSVNNFGGTTLTLQRSGGSNPQDLFSATGDLGFSTGTGTLTLLSTNIGTYSNTNGQLTLTFANGITNAQVNQTMQSIAYENNSDAPPATVQIDWTFNDANAGAQGSGPALQDMASTLVTVQPVNDAPVLSNIEVAQTSYSENGTPVAVTTSLVVSDVDDTNIESATISIVNNQTDDILSFTPQFGITGNFSAATGALTLSGSALTSQYETVLRSVTYHNTSDNPSIITRTIDFVVNDGDDDSNLLSRDIVVTAFNDAPVLSSIETTTVPYTENGPPVVITTSLVVNDDDDTNIESAIASIVNNQADDVLSFTAQFGITGSFSAATGELTLNGSALRSEYETVLRSVTYHNTSDNPSAVTRIIDFVVNDGDIDSNLPSRDVVFNAANDAPVITLSGPETYFENSPATTIAPAAMVSDVDSADFDGGAMTIAITSGANAADRLSIISTGSGPGQVSTGLTALNYQSIQIGSYTGGDGTNPLLINFNSAATPAAVQAVLRQVAFEHFSENPQTTRTLQLTLTDGDTGSTTQSEALNIIPVNDRPALNSLGGETVFALNNGAVYNLDQGVTASIFDPDAAIDFNGGSLNLTGVNFTTGDQLGIDTTSVALSAGLSNGSAISIGGANIGTLVSISPSTLNINFNSAAAVGHIDALVHAFTFDSTSRILGQRAIDYTLIDGDGTANGGEDTISSRVNVFVGLSGGGSITTDEDTFYPLDVNDFVFTGSPASSIQNITITAPPINGSLELNGMTVNAGDEITRAELDASLLTYVPPSEQNGMPYAMFSFYINNGNSTFTILPGENSLNTFSGGSWPEADAIIANNDNFGPTGTVPTAVSVAAPTNTTNNSYLSQGNLMVNGFVVDGKISTAEFNTIDAWVQAGGLLISTSDTDMADDINSMYGLTTLAGGDTIWTIANAAHPIIDGAFGLVGNLGDTFTGAGTVGQFDPASLAAGDLVLATDSATGNPTIVFRSVGAGFVVFTSDEGIFRDNMTGSGLISTANDRLVANLIAWAISHQPPSELFTTNVHVTPVNDAPAISGVDPTAITYIENGAQIVLSNMLTLSDIDDTNIESATISITNQAAGDVLSFTSQFGITGSFSAASGELTLNGSALLSQYEAALRSVTYHNTSDDPSEVTRTIEIVVNDGDDDSNLVSRNITFTAINDAPVLSTIETTTAAYTENDTPIAITSNIVVSDEDDTNIDSAFASITNNQAGDVLSFTPQFGITGGFNSSTGELTLGGSALLSQYESVLRSISYHNTTENPSAVTRTIEFVVTDGEDDSNLALREITFTEENDAPILSAVETTPLTYIENAAPVGISPNIELGDVDDPHIESAKVTILSNFVQGKDELIFIDQFGIIGDFNSDTGVLTLNGTATIAEYETAMRSISFENTSDNPSTLTRSVNFVVNDGDNESAPQIREIEFTAVNDSPELNGIEPLPASYSENAAPIDVTRNLTVNDVDNVNIELATITISGNYEPAQDVLLFSDQFGISGDFNSTTGVLTLSGPATSADYETAIRSVTYENTSDNPSTLNRTLEFSAEDGDLESNTQYRTIVVNAINDNPTQSNIETSSLSVTENQAATIITETLAVDDVDDTVIESASVIISQNYSIGEDLLGYNGVANISGSFDDTLGMLSLTGNASAADYETALRSVTYQNVSDNPILLTRTIEFTTNDGDKNSNTVSRGVEVFTINDPPSGTDGSASSLEDSNYTLTAIDFGFNDLDSNSFSGVIIDQPPTSGELRLSGIPVETNDFVGIADINAGKFEFVPIENTNGANYDQFDFRVVDDGGTALSGLDTAIYANNFSFDVINVNDAPEGGNNTVTITEDTSYTFKRGDFSFTDIHDNDQFIAITITALPTAGLLANNGIEVAKDAVVSVTDIDAGLLQYTPPPDVNGLGYNGFAFRVHDNGGDSNNGQFIDPTDNFVNFDVPGVNDPPLLINQGKNVDEASNSVITVNELAASDADNTPTELSFTISSLPVNGELTLNGVTLLVNDSFTVEQLEQNQIRYIHDGSETSADSFTFEVSDGGGDGVLPIAGTFSLTVNEVIDPPPVISDEHLSVEYRQTFDSTQGDELTSGNNSLAFTAMTENPAFTIAIKTQANHGEAVVNPDGTLTYEHHGSFEPTDSFEYEVTNEDNVSSTRTVHVQIALPLQNAVDGGEPLNTIENSPQSESTDESTVEQVPEENFEFLPERPKTSSLSPEPAEITVVIPVYDGNHSKQSTDLQGYGTLEKIDIKQHNKVDYIEIENQIVAFSNIESLIEVETNNVREAVSNKNFQDGLNRVDKELQENDPNNNKRYQLAYDTTVGVSISATAGILAWAMRGGAILASAVAYTPLWGSLDPLSVVGKRRDGDDADDNVVEQYFSDEP